MKKLFLALACAASLSGCAAMTAERWPTPGTGGFAEWTPIPDDALAAMRARLEALRDRDAETYAAADFDTAQTLLTRVERETVAGLDIDGAVDFRELDHLVSGIETRMSKQRTPRRRS
jgi:hypothetical protein